MLPTSVAFKSLHVGCFNGQLEPCIVLGVEGTILTEAFHPMGFAFIGTLEP